VRSSPSPAGPTIPSGATVYSFSRLSTYRGCGRKYELSYVEKAPRQPQGSLIGGSAVHATIEVAEANRWWRDPTEQAYVWLEREFLSQFHEIAGEQATMIHPDHGLDYEGVRWGGRKSKAFPYGENVQWWEREGPKMLERWHMLRGLDSINGYALLDDVELEVSAMLDENTYVRGFIDALRYVNADGERLIRDWKTGSSAGDPSQLATYAWMLREGPGIVATQGELVMLRQQTNQIKTFDLTKWIDLVPMMFRNLARGIEHEIFPISPSNFCVACTVKDSCEWGVTLT